MSATNHEIIIGVPGNRKTSYIVSLANECRASNTRVLIFSFTRSAVFELKDRIGSIDDDEITIATMHSFCANITSTSGDGAIMLQTVISECNDLLNTHPEWLNDPVNRYDVICVDETQDNNAEQFELVKILVTAWNCRCVVVGDPSQSIYGFQGARVDLLDTLAADLEKNTGRKCITTFRDLNYRCSAPIIKAANLNLLMLGGCILMRCGDSKSNKRPIITVSSSYQHELESIIHIVEDILKSSPTSRLSDIVILHRTNSGLSQIARAVLEFYDVDVFHGGGGETEGTAQVPREDSLQLRTLHGSKGTTYQHVIVAGVTDGTVPSRFSNDFIEERRLLHVGMTRGVQSLHITTVCSDQNRLSQFISPSDVEDAWDVIEYDGAKLKFTNDENRVYPTPTTMGDESDQIHLTRDDIINHPEMLKNAISAGNLSSDQMANLRHLINTIRESTVMSENINEDEEDNQWWHIAPDVRKLQETALNIISDVFMSDALKIRRKFSYRSGIGEVLLPALSKKDIETLKENNIYATRVRNKLYGKHAAIESLLCDDNDNDDHAELLARHYFSPDSFRKWDVLFDNFDRTSDAHQRSKTIFDNWKKILHVEFDDVNDFIETALLCATRINSIPLLRLNKDKFGIDLKHIAKMMKPGVCVMKEKLNTLVKMNRLGRIDAVVSCLPSGVLPDAIFNIVSFMRNAKSDVFISIDVGQTILWKTTMNPRLKTALQDFIESMSHTGSPIKRQRIN